MGGLLLPFVTGGGVLVRAAVHADDAVDAARAVNAAGNAAQAANQAANAAQAATRAADTAGSARAAITRAGLLGEISRGTSQSRRVTEGIEQGRIGMNVVGDNLFERALRHYDPAATGDLSRTVGFAVGNQAYVRQTARDAASVLVHEGVHVLDSLSGVPRSVASLERRAYYFERQFQIVTGRRYMRTLNDIVRHIADFY